MKKASWHFWDIFRLMARCDKKALFRIVALTFLDSILPMISLYVLKMIVDRLGGLQSTWQLIMPPVIMFAVLFLLSRITVVLQVANRDVFSQRLTDYVTSLVHKKSSELDMGFYDSSSYHDTLYQAQQEAYQRPAILMGNAIVGLGSLLSMGWTLIILASSLSWSLPVLLLSILPSFIVRIVKSKELYVFKLEKMRLYRRGMYLSRLLTDKNYVMEVKTRGLASFFQESYLSIRKDLLDTIGRIIRRISLYDVLCAVFEASALLAVSLLLIKGTVTGALTVGSFVMLFEAFRRAQVHLQKFIVSLTALYDGQLFMEKLFDFLSLEPEIKTTATPKPFPENISSVEFRNISFTYPGADKPSVNHFSLTARKGEICRIEGPNGFGKTTLVKLLLRLYDPQEGGIYINGTDIRDFDVNELRHAISPVFQNVIMYMFSVRENIVFGDYGAGMDEDRLLRAAKSSDADGFISRLPQGYDTPLGRDFDNGEELSMGQCQRLAIARQFYSNAPIYVFDEPTAWMDKKTRELFHQTLESIRGEKVIFMISHIQ